MTAATLSPPLASPAPSSLLGRIAAPFTLRSIGIFQSQAIAAVSPLLIADLALSPTSFGVLVSAYALPALFLSVPGAMLARRVGDRRAMTAAMVLVLAGTLITTLAPGLAVALLGRVIAGAGGSVISSLCMKVTTDRCAGPSLGTASGLVLASYPFGVAAATLGLGTLAALAGWREAMLAAVVVAAFGLLGASRLSGAAGVPPSARSGLQLELTRDERQAALWAAAAWAAINASLASFIAFLPSQLVARGLGPAEVAATASLFGWILTALAPFGGVAADRLKNPDLSIGTSLLLTAAFMGCAVVFGAPVWTMAAIGAVLLPAPGALVGRLGVSVAPQSRSVAFGIFGSGSAVGLLGGPAVAGLAQQLTGRIEAPIVWAAIAMALAAGCWFGGRRVLRG